MMNKNIFINERFPDEDGIYLCRCVNEYGDIEYRVDTFTNTLKGFPKDSSCWEKELSSKYKVMGFVKIDKNIDKYFDSIINPYIPCEFGIKHTQDIYLNETIIDTIVYYTSENYFYNRDLEVDCIVKKINFNNNDYKIIFTMNIYIFNDYTIKCCLTNTEKEKYKEYFKDNKIAIYDLESGNLTRRFEKYLTSKLA